MEICSTFGSTNITGCWPHDWEMHSMNADISNAAGDKISIMGHGGGVEASFPLT
jgi:hypothetical protein